MLKNALQRSINRLCMTPAIALNMMNKINNMQEVYSKNADKQELINILNVELKKVSKILDMVENLRVRVKLGEKKEVLDIVGLCREKGIGNLNNRIEQVNKEKLDNTIELK